MKPILTCTFAGALAMSFGCAAVGGGRRLERSPEIPAARGTVRFMPIGDEGTGIDLRVEHLEEPDRLSAPGYAYVAWVRSTPEDEAQNVGSLCLDAHLGGTLRAVAPLRRFELFVTAEATSDAARPTGERLLWASRE